MISIRAMSSFCRCKRRTERFCNIQQLNTVRLVDIDQSSTSVYRRSRRQFNETRCAKGFGDNGTSQKPVKQGNKEVCSKKNVFSTLLLCVSTFSPILSLICIQTLFLLVFLERRVVSKSLAVNKYCSCW